VIILAVSGFAWINPSISALVSRRSDAAHQGEVLGVNQGCTALARIIGPFLGSLLFPLTVPPLLPYLSGVVLVVLAAHWIGKATASPQADRREVAASTPPKVGENGRGDAQPSTSEASTRTSEAPTR